MSEGGEWAAPSRSLAPPRWACLSPCQPLVDSAVLSSAKACWPELSWEGQAAFFSGWSLGVAGTFWWSLCAGLWVLGNVLWGARRGTQGDTAGRMD